MKNLERLIQKTAEEHARLLIQFDPNEQGEEWGIKFYPDAEDNGHFYAYTSGLDESARLILDELRGISA